MQLKNLGSADLNLRKDLFLILFVWTKIHSYYAHPLWQLRFSSLLFTNLFKCVKAWLPYFCRPPDSHFEGQRQRTLKMETLARTQLLFENITLLEVPENQSFLHLGISYYRVIVLKFIPWSVDLVPRFKNREQPR